MRVTRFHFPIHLGLGEPALRLAEVAILYPYGPVVTHGNPLTLPGRREPIPARAIVFESTEVFSDALRVLKTNRPTDEKLESFHGDAIDVAEAPCLECRRIIALSAAHACAYWSKVQAVK